MRHNTLRRHPLSGMLFDLSEVRTSWLWTGYLHEGEITLLTSQWKTGKTTLITGLLRQLASGGEFLGLPLKPGKAWIVSEESLAMWATRLQRRPVGEHVELLARPFRGKPSQHDWEELINDDREARAKGELDLLVIDPLAGFFPGRSEADPHAIRAMLDPLQDLCGSGVAVLILHHPRKKPSEEGASARGTGALLGFVDHVLELTRLGPLKAERYQRLLVAQSRHRETPARLAFEWNPATDEFTAIPEPFAKQFELMWPVLETILRPREVPATAKELFADWPIDQPKPAQSTFYAWLHQATAKKLVRRSGQGVNKKPWRFRLPNEDDEYYDRGELPPLRDLPPLW